METESKPNMDPLNDGARFEREKLTRRAFLRLAGVSVGFAALQSGRTEAAQAPAPTTRDGTATPQLLTATTHPMRYYLSLPKGWCADRAWPVLVAPNAHYGDKGKNLLAFAAERDRRQASFIIVQPVVINADRVEAMTEYRGAVADRIKAADTATDGRDEGARAKFDENGILAILADIRARYHGEEKVCIAGFSSSTHVAYLMLMNHPELLKAVVVNSGVYAGRGVDEHRLPRTNSAERAATAVKCLIGEKDPHYEFYHANWLQTKAKLLTYGHPAARLQEEIIASAGHQWFHRKILDFCLLSR